MRRLLCLLLLAHLVAALAANSQMSRPTTERPGVQRSIAVPFRYENRQAGSFTLEYELGYEFDRSKQTVFVIADGQQFYVRHGLVAPLQDELFGDQFNVVGIIGRGHNDAVKQHIRLSGQIDWIATYELLKADEWIEDIESVRKDLLGPDGVILLYGRSGGGLLVHQYLAKHPQHVRAAFTQAAVNRFLDAEFGLSSDGFWQEIGTYDSKLRPQLLGALQAHPAERNRIMLLLQRQNFFVAAERIQEERTRLIRALGRWDQEEIKRLSKEYQVDAMLSVLADHDPASTVRLFELFAPVLGRPSSATDRVDPDIEVGKMFAAPLLPLLDRGEVAKPSMDLRALYRANTDVYLLAGRYDHTADYRTQIALASHYSSHRLLLLNDNHDFPHLQKTGLYPRLVQAALAHGIRSPESIDVERDLAPLIFMEY